MSWLSAIFLGRSVDISLARQTADLKGRPPTSLGAVCGWVSGVAFLIGCGFGLQIFGVEEVSLLVAIAFLIAAVVVGAVVADTVNRTLGR